MKKCFLRGVCVLLFGLLVLAGSDSMAAKALPKEKAKKLVKQMERYECAYIASHNMPASKSIKFTKAEKAKAAALSLSTRKLLPLTKGEFGGTETWKLADPLLKKASVNLFGKAVTSTKLRKNPKQSKICVLGDAYRNRNGVPVVYYSDGETEIDYTTLSTSVSKQGKSGCKVIKSVYYGYWGNNNGKSNYKIIYKVVSNKKSKNGCIIKRMQIKKV